MLPKRKLIFLILTLVPSFVFVAVISCSARVAHGAAISRTPYGYAAVISDVSITRVTSTTAVISWRTDPAAESHLYLDSAIQLVFGPQPTNQAFQGVAYAPGEYDAYLSHLDRGSITDTIVSDIDAAAKANFNTIVLYPAGPLDGKLHSWDQTIFDASDSRGLEIAFRLEWYPLDFDWESADCDAILNHYHDYLEYFSDHLDHLAYLLINMPLDDLKFAYPNNPTIEKQRDYIAYCYSSLKALVPGAKVYANTYYGWRDELHQAPVGDLVDGVSVVVYAQYSADAPFDCDTLPTADDPASGLICKDQFDYYLDKAWNENHLAALGKPLLLDSTGFAPTVSYADPAQKNGRVADSRAKVRAIETLRRYFEQDSRLDGWSYFMLLHKDEADWGLIDRRPLTDSIRITHQLTLTDLFPSTPYTFSIRAGDGVSGVYTFTTRADLPPANVPPLLTITRPPYGNELIPPGGPLPITWEYDGPTNNARLYLYHDKDDAGCDGSLIVGGLPVAGTLNLYTWTLPLTLPTGSHYAYGQIGDGTGPIECDYSTGQFVPSTETLKVLPLVSEVITIDGAMNEPIWQSAISLTFATHPLTDTTTATVRAFWDRDYLYLSYVVSDAHVETAAGDDWNDDSVSAVFNDGGFNCRRDIGGTGEGDCDRAVYMPPCTTLNNDSDHDCGFTVEMRIQWSKLGITANANDVIPIDFLSVDHDGNPNAPYDDPGTAFSKLSWDGDGSIDTTGRSLTLEPVNKVYLPLVVR